MKKINFIKLFFRSGLAAAVCLVFLSMTGCRDSGDTDSLSPERTETGPFTVKLDAGVSKISTDAGGLEPFIVISRLGGSEVGADTPTPIRVDAGVYVTLLVTVPDTHLVTNFKVNNSIAPQKISAGGVSPAEYRFKMPAAAAVISGTLTPKTPADLIKVDSVFNSALQELHIAQGVLSLSQLSVKQSAWHGVSSGVSKSSGAADGASSGDGQSSEGAASVFDPKKVSYYAAVPFSGYPAVVTAIPDETEAGVVISQSTVSDGVFTVTIEVTAPFWKLYPNYTAKDGDPALPAAAASKTTSYSVVVARGAGDSTAALSSLRVLQASFDSPFESAAASYAGTVGTNVEKLDVSAVAAHPNARVQLVSGAVTHPANLGDAGNSISASVPAPAQGGSGSVRVRVTAEDAVTTGDYVINIFREGQKAVKPVFNATGGIATKQVVKNGAGVDVLYEIHAFIVDEKSTPLGGQVFDKLCFDKKPAGGTVEVLVVAGGGGGGKSEGDKWRAGGGGAGGFIYHPAYGLGDDKEFIVKVGAGGAAAAGVENSKGGAGGDSGFGAEFIAYGGGGGGSHGGGYGNGGGDGGGGGGGGNGAMGMAKIGMAPAGCLNLGNNGGAISSINYSGSGGGGAAEAGAAVTVTNSGGSGGAGTQSAVSGALMWYSGGGAGGAEDKYNVGGQYGAGQGNGGVSGSGDGGSGGGGVAGKDNGGNGGSGVVIVRWPFTP
jgi:hypothetical protein